MRINCLGKLSSILLLSVFFAAFSTGTVSQLSNPQVIELPYKPIKIYLNDRNQLYLVTKNSLIIKTNLKGDTLFTFEDKAQEITALDVTNPMRILALSSSFNTLTFLDQTLSPISERIALDVLNIPFVSAFAFSRDNNFWVFNEIEQTLVKIDQNTRIKSVSQKIYLLINENIQPVQILERNNRVYVMDKSVGLLEFDFMGTFKFHYKIVKGDEFDIVGNKVIYRNDDALFTFDMVLLEHQKIKVPIDNLAHFAVNAQNLVLNSGKKLIIAPLNF